MKKQHYEKKPHSEEEIQNAKANLRFIGDLIANPIWIKLTQNIKADIENEQQAHFTDEKYEDPALRDAHYHQIRAKLDQAGDLQFWLNQINETAKRISNVSND